MAIRFRTRHLRATIVNRVRDGLDTLGWVTGTINFAADPITVIDYAPDTRSEIITTNTVAVSIGDVVNDEDMELGAQTGGLRSGWYPVFIDVYMASQALSDAVCDDLRSLFDMDIFPLIDQTTGLPAASGETLEIEEVIGPDRPTYSGGSIDGFRRYWRIMRLGVRLYYQS